MNEDDPFDFEAEGNKTKILPRPGGKTRFPSQSFHNTGAADSGPMIMPNARTVKNPLIEAAFPLLALAGRLRSTSTHGDIEALRNQFISEIKRFEHSALQLRVLPDTIKSAKYAICALIDDIVLNTPWGHHSSWVGNNLVVMFYREGGAGEAFFKNLNHLAKQPAANLNLIELFYYCLTLGFIGKYRSLPNGASKLNDLRESLFILLQRQKGGTEQDLSSHWQGIQDKRNALIRYAPLWLIASLTGALLVIIFIGFKLWVDKAATPNLKQLDEIKLMKPIVKPVVEPIGEPENRDRPIVFRIVEDLRQRLAIQIEQGSVEILETQQGTIIRVRGLYPSGRSEIKTEYIPLVKKIAQIISNSSNDIMVLGHSDDRPISTARFPSNWHLSKARAESMARQIESAGGYKLSVGAIGRAEEDPLVPNDTKQNRALNRRIEIILRE